MSENTGSAKAKESGLSIEKKRRTPSKKAEKFSEPSFNLDELQALASLVDEHGFTDFEFENENIRVRLCKMASSGYQMPPVAAAPAPVLQQAPSPSVGTAEAAVAASIDVDAGLHKITSPIVGTFYRSAGPDKDPYVTEGSKVSPETTVCIVEAMKLMNEIQAEISGEVVKIYIENGQPVEYGQALFGIKK